MSDLDDKQRELEGLHIEREIADERMEIAKRRALEREAKRHYGRNWRKVIGNVRPNAEAIQTLYAAGTDLKELGKPRGVRRA